MPILSIARTAYIYPINMRAPRYARRTKPASTAIAKFRIPVARTPTVMLDGDGTATMLHQAREMWLLHIHRVSAPDQLECNFRSRCYTQASSCHASEFHGPVSVGSRRIVHGSR